MTLIKWKKNNGVFPGTFSNWMDDFFNDEALSQRWSGINKPSVNVKESKDSYTLEVAAPGFGKNDFNIDVDDNILTISGNKETEKDESNEGYTRREFNYTSFKRSFTLPESVNVDKINGKYGNGILNVVLPKKEEATTPKKTIKIS